MRQAIQRGTARRTSQFGLLLGVLMAVGVVVAASSAAPSVPAPTISVKPVNPTSQTSATFTYTDSSAITKFQCRLDAAAFADCGTTRPSTTVYAGPLANGSHTFQVKAFDGAQQSSETTYTWVVDTAAPAAPAITSGPPLLPGWTTTTNASFSFTGESGASFLCSLDNPAPGAFTACSSAKSYSGVAQGAHTFYVKARDAAGNTGPSASRAWQVDSIAPPAPVLTDKPDDPNGSAISTFTWTDAEAGVTFECSIENGAYQPGCSSPFTFEVIVDTSNNGQHQFAVQAVDAAGNRSAPTTYRWKVDKDVRFTITGNAGGLLYPGIWRQLVLTLHNPNNFTIYVTSLQVVVDNNPVCPTNPNFAVQQSDIDATVAKRVAVPANGTAPVPAARAPQLQLVNTTVNQDVCKNQTLALSYSGTAVK